MNRKSNSILLSMLLVVFSLCAAIMYTPTMILAASFDCKKASTRVEKMICADEEYVSTGLSKLDDDMSRAYADILEQADDEKTIKSDQRKWLKERNMCVDRACIQEAYEERFVTLHASVKWPETITPSNGKTVESHLFPKEADKLKQLQKLLRDHELSLYSKSQSEGDIQKCGQIMQGLHNSKITAVEPDVLAVTAYDLELKKWRVCEGKEVRDTDVTDPNQFFDHMGTLGGPPYRAYYLDIDGNPENGKEDLLYHEAGNGYRSTGYTRVDLDACVIQGGAGAVSQFWVKPMQKNNPEGFYFFSLIGQYEDEYLVLVIYPMTRDFRIPNYTFNVWRLNNEYPRLCVWEEATSK